MRVYLDDERTTPEGWTRTYTVAETIELLKTGNVMELSLDNDLGDGQDEGYKVMEWLEKEVIMNGFVPPRRFKFHTHNLVRRDYMRAAARSIWAHTHNDAIVIIGDDVEII